MKNKDKLAVGFCFLVAFVILLICSRSSFLYPCNDWNDANSYFTMGKAMMNGQVIYRDLYDQKGPYLYLVYGIAYLFSGTSFVGVFVLEILAVGLFLYASYKIICLYCKEDAGFLLLPVLAAVTLSSKSFYWGGSAEEFCLPLLSFSLFYSIRYFKEQFKEAPGLKMLLVNGIFAGIVMQVKYTMLGFYFAWMTMMLISFLMKKDFKGMFKGCFTFLLGMLVTFLPWLFYFGINGALGDWYQCYVYNNVFLYSNLTGEENGLGKRIYDLAKILLWLLLDNPYYFIFIIVGVLFFVLSFKIKWIEKINIVMMCSCLFLGIYVGGSVLPYYSIPLMIFTVLGMISAGKLLEKCRVPSVFSMFILGVGVFFVYQVSMNSYFMKQSREDYFLFKFQEIISEEENPSLVTIGCLDAGLYTVTDIMPTCRFFQTNGIGLQEMFEEQDKYVKEGKTQFILTRDVYPDGISKHYELVGEEPYEWDGRQYTYSLFRRKQKN